MRSCNFIYMKSSKLLIVAVITVILFQCFIRLKKRNNDEMITRRILNKERNALNLNKITYCTYYNFTVADNMRIQYPYMPISLALHSSIDYTFNIIEQAERWDDFISYSIYLYPGAEFALSNLLKLHRCHKQVFQKVSIHLIWGLGAFQRSCETIEDFLYELYSKTNFSCDDFGDAIEELKMIKLPIVYNYPINVMRNEARRGAQTKLVIIADVENFFSPNFAVQVRNLTQKLLEKDHEKDVLIYRRFEMTPNISFPSSLKDIQKYYHNQLLFEFHSKFFHEGHSIPNLGTWFEYGISRKAVVAEYIPYNRSKWEPQFIFSTVADPPFHPEEIPTRFLDHQAFVNEMCRSGYNFYLLSHVFNIHYGIKRNHTLREKLLSKSAQVPGIAFLKQFNKYLDFKYPKTKKSCPPLF